MAPSWSPTLKALNPTIPIVDSLTNESRLLTACARATLRPEDVAKIRALCRCALNWEVLLESADRHGVSPLLYWHLREQISQTAPSAPMELLRARFEKNAYRNLFLTGELLKVLDAFKDANIRVLAYKGPVQAALLYGNLALREISDLDLLIDPATFPAARKLVLGLGFRPALTLTPKQEASRLSSDCEYEFVGPDGTICLDLHWNIAPPHMGQCFYFDDLWQRRGTLLLGGRSLATFSAEDLVVILAVHGGKHVWERLCWLSDFAKCLQAPNLDWAILRTRARAARAEKMLLLAFSLAQGMMGVQLPVDDLSIAVNADTVLQGIATRIERNLFRPELNVETDVARWLALLRLSDHGWDRVRSVARFAFGSGPREWQTVSLPDSLFAFYPILRIAALLRQAPSLLFSRSPAPDDTQGRMQKDLASRAGG
ncbi:MAG: nucleotidyltransferase family protein [Candidatus Sulfotelmatobacter sp.]